MQQQFNYEYLKQLGKDLGRRVADLLALSPKNDPFYTGTPADLAKGAWFADVYHRAGYSQTRAPHLRRVHYWTVSQEPAILMPDGKPYENTERCWEFLIEASKAARYLGLVAISGIVDNKNPNPHVHAWYSEIIDPGFSIDIPELDDPYVSLRGLEVANVQPYHLEIWCEKSTMNDVLMPICQRYSANLVTFEGEVSITSVCVSLMNRIKASGGKPTRIFYISDFDPAGNSMPVAMSRKVEYAIRTAGTAYDVKVKPLALTIDLIQQYKLPRIPIKETELRAPKFEQAFGTGAVELDALEALYPGTLAALVRDAISVYYHREAASAVYEQRDALRQAVDAKIKAITSKYQEQIAALRDMQDELREISIDTTPYEVERYAPHVTEGDEWLYDSNREYLTQITHYKLHKGIIAEEITQ